MDNQSDSGNMAGERIELNYRQILDLILYKKITVSDNEVTAHDMNYYDVTHILELLKNDRENIGEILKDKLTELINKPANKPPYRLSIDNNENLPVCVIDEYLEIAEAENLYVPEHLVHILDKIVRDNKESIFNPGTVENDLYEYAIGKTMNNFVCSEKKDEIEKKLREYCACRSNVYLAKDALYSQISDMEKSEINSMLSQIDNLANNSHELYRELRDELRTANAYSVPASETCCLSATHPPTQI